MPKVTQLQSRRREKADGSPGPSDSQVPTINHQTMEKKSVVGVQKGREHISERFLEKVAFYCTCNV